MSDYSQWLGKSETRLDCMHHDHALRVAATLNETAPQAGEALPLLWHWTYFQEPVPSALTGPDGHPKTGGFLPEVGDKVRMWAGGRLSFLKSLKVGMPAERVSTIANISEKVGRTGSLLFVTVKHEYRQAGELMISEEQDIVYRDASISERKLSTDDMESDWTEAVDLDPVTLFRYSAVTFNSHRIHYDWRYVTEIEGYPGLVIHGPLTATLVLRAFTRAKPDSTVRSFAFKGVKPLIQGDEVRLNGRIDGAGQATVWASSAYGTCQVGSVGFG